ncbi:hypothetical protein ACVIW0_001989 [Bradyrhizobium sp. USDA 4454]
MPPESPPDAAPAPDASDPSPPHQPGLFELFLAFARIVAGRLWPGPGLGPAVDRRAAPLSRSA